MIAVRGTETPEDLLIDGLCRECALSMDDLDGLLKLVSLSLCILFVNIYTSIYPYRIA